MMIIFVNYLLNIVNVQQVILCIIICNILYVKTGKMPLAIVIVSIDLVMTHILLAWKTDFDFVRVLQKLLPRVFGKLTVAS